MNNTNSLATAGLYTLTNYALSPYTGDFVSARREHLLQVMKSNKKKRNKIARKISKASRRKNRR